MNQVPNYEDWVKSFISNLANHFNLHGWSIHVVFSDKEAEDDVYAHSCINSAYMESVITLFPRVKQEFYDKKIDGLIISIVHELVHILLDPLHEWMDPFLSKATTPAYINTLEQQTQKITMIFLKNLPLEFAVLISGVLNDKEDSKEESNEIS